METTLYGDAESETTSVLQDIPDNELILIEKHIYHHSADEDTAPRVTTSVRTLKRHTRTRQNTTDSEAFIHLIKGSLGSGILSLPYAFLQIGFAAGIFTNIYLSYLSYYGSYALVRSSQEISKKDKMHGYSYAMTVYRVLQEYGGCSRRTAECFRLIVLITLVSNLFGICSVYVAITAANVKSIMQWFDGPDWDIRIIVAMQVPVLFIVNSIPSLKYLTPVSMFANVCVWCGLSFTLYYIFEDFPSPSEADIVQIAPVTNIPIYFSIAIFAFTSVGFVLPIENEMRRPSHFLGWPSVLGCSFVVLTFVYTIYGAVGYWRYGSSVQQSIFLNLDETEVFAVVIKIFLALGVFFSFPLAFYAGFTMLYAEVMKYVDKACLFYLLKYSLIVFIITINLLVPQIAILIALNGAITVSILQYILPLILYTIVMWGKQTRLGKTWALSKLSFFILFGLFLLVSGLFYSILDIIEFYSTEKATTRSSIVVIYV